MSYMYAVQVPVGKELNVKKMLLDFMQRMGNPGITEIHALETFEQTLSTGGMSSKRWKAKLPGYIFVAVSESIGLGMDAACWQLIKHIPLVRNILNRYIPHEEWEKFFDNVDLEPEIQIVKPGKNRKPTRKELKEYWNNLTDAHTQPEQTGSVKVTQPAEVINPPEPEEPPIAAIIETAAEVLEKTKDQAVAGMKKLVTAVQTLVHRGKTTYNIPFKLYKILLRDYHKKAGGGKQMTVQDAYQKLKALLKAVMIT